MIYGYCRVSTDMQECSAEAQQRMLKEYAARAGVELAAVYVDEDVSGSIPLKDRPQGKLMWDALAPGDTVVITTKDRAFRSLIDAAATLMRWREYGVKLYIIDFPVDLSTDEGEMVFLQGAVFSQYERKQIARRIRVGISHRKKSGMPYCYARPWGWVRSGDRWTHCPKERLLGDRVLAMRKEGKSWYAIASHFMNEKKPIVRKKASPYYHQCDIRSLAAAAAAGYPKIPQAAWLRRDTAQKLSEAISPGSPIST